MSMNGLILAAYPTIGTVNVGDCQDLECLPVLRWATQAGAVTSRQDGVSKFFNPLLWVNNIGSNLTGMLTSMGNGLWSSAAWLANGGDPEKALRTAGPAANQFAGRLYTALFNTSTVIPFITIPIFITVVIGLFAAYGRQGWKVMCQRSIALCAGLGMFFAMGATSAAHPNDAYPMTPYWLVSTSNEIIGKAGGGIVDAFNDGLTATGSFVADPKAGPNMLSCRRYTAGLNDAAKRQGKDALANSINLMWEETGLRIWMRSAYGTGSNASNVFCRVLEYRTGETAEHMRNISSATTGETGAYLSQNAIAWWPSLMSLKTELTGEVKTDDPSDTNDQMLDRYVMLFNTCQLNQNGSWSVRPGFGFLGAIEGSSRKKAGYWQDGEDTTNTPELIPRSCAAAFTGSDNEKPGSEMSHIDYYATVGSANDAQVVTGNGVPKEGDAKTGTRIDSERYAERKNVANLITLFDVNTATSNWQQLLQKWGGGSYQERNNAMQTILQQHGESGAGDILAAILFALSGLVALIVWGLCCGLLKTLALVVASFLTVGGIYIGCLILAFAPEKGQRAVKNAGLQCAAWIAGPTLVSMFASAGVLFVNTGMTMLKIVNVGGDTTGGMLTLTLATLILPLAFLKLVQYLCVKVWGFGDPLSLPGIATMAGFGSGIKNGLKMAAGGLAAGGMAMLAGGGIASALSSMGRVASAGGHMGLFASGAAGWNEGQWDSYRNSRKDTNTIPSDRTGSGGAGTSTPIASEADRAAGETTPTVDTTTPEITPNGTESSPSGETPIGDVNGSKTSVETDTIPHDPVVSISGSSENNQSVNTTPVDDTINTPEPVSDGNTTIIPPVTPTVNKPGEKPYLNSEGKPVINPANNQPFTFTSSELVWATRQRRKQLRKELYQQGFRGQALQNEINGRMDPAHNIGIWDDIRANAQNLHDTSLQATYDTAYQTQTNGFGDELVQQPVHHETPEWIRNTNNFVKNTVDMAKNTVSEVADSRVGQMVGRTMDRTTTWMSNHPHAAATIAATAALAVPGVAPLAVAATWGGSHVVSSVSNPKSLTRRTISQGVRFGRTVADQAGSYAASVKAFSIPIARKLGTKNGVEQVSLAVNRMQQGVDMNTSPIVSFTPQQPPVFSQHQNNQMGPVKPIPVDHHVRIPEANPQPVSTFKGHLPLNPQPIPVSTSQTPVDPDSTPQQVETVPLPQSRIVGSRLSGLNHHDPEQAREIPVQHLLPTETEMEQMSQDYEMNQSKPNESYTSMFNQRKQATTTTTSRDTSSMLPDEQTIITMNKEQQVESQPTPILVDEPLESPVKVEHTIPSTPVIVTPSQSDSPNTNNPTQLINE